MGRHVIETIMGAVVLAVAAFFLVFAYSHADLGAVKGYTLKARFGSVGGLANGGDVRINGIKVGTVVAQSIDNQSFLAEATLSIRPDIRLPQDTEAVIDSDGLLGGKFVKLVPGRSTAMLAEGATITKTRNYRALEEMVGEIIFLATGSGPGGAPAGDGR